MFNKNYRLIGQMVGLVAVLVVLLVLPSGSQPIGPCDMCPSRAKIVGSLSQVFGATLVAGEAVAWDVESAVFFSHPEVTLAFTPLQLTEGPRVKEAILTEILVGKEGASTIIGGVYITDPIEVRDPVTAPAGPFFPLHPGTYVLKLVSGKDMVNRIMFIDEEGNEVLAVPAEIKIIEGDAATKRLGPFVRQGLSPVGKMQVEIGAWFPAKTGPAPAEAEIAGAVAPGSFARGFMVGVLVAAALCMMCY